MHLMHSSMRQQLQLVRSVTHAATTPGLHATSTHMFILESIAQPMTLPCAATMMRGRTVPTAATLCEPRSQMPKHTRGSDALKLANNGSVKSL